MYYAENNQVNAGICQQPRLFPYGAAYGLGGMPLRVIRRRPFADRARQGQPGQEPAAAIGEVVYELHKRAQSVHGTGALLIIVLQSIIAVLRRDR